MLVLFTLLFFTLSSECQARGSSAGRPAAKTLEEYRAYTQAVGIDNPEEAEKAAEGFATAYPTSELRYLAFSRALKLYRQANDGDAVVRLGRRVLALRPNDPAALVMISTVLAERTAQTDPERSQKYAEAVADAQRLVETIDTGLVAPPHASQRSVQQAKDSLLAAAHASIGMVEFNRGNFAGADAELRASLIRGRENPDPLIWLRLGLAQDQEKRYADALSSVNQAIGIAAADSKTRALAMREQRRLLPLVPEAARSR